MKLSAFDILNVNFETDDESVKKAYLNEVKKNPPDINPEQFKVIRDAFEQIKNAECRSNYLLFDRPTIGIKAYIDHVLEDTTHTESVFSDDLFSELLKEAINA